MPTNSLSDNDLMNEYNQYHVSTNQTQHAANQHQSTHTMHVTNQQSESPGGQFKMASNVQLENFSGESSIHPKTWWAKFQLWVDLYDIPTEKVIQIIAFQFNDEAAIWYATLKPEVTNDLETLKRACFKRFTEDGTLVSMENRVLRLVCSRFPHF